MHNQLNPLAKSVSDAYRVHMAMEGRYKLEVKNAKGEVTKSIDWFENLIVNAGLDHLMTKATNANSALYCMVGSGTTAPTAGDTTLQTPVGATTNTLSTTPSVLGVSPYYSAVVVVYQFTPGQATGTLGEVGVGWTNSLVFSRSLIKDSGGVPTTIEVLADEYLNVTYEFRLSPPLTDATQTLTISSVSYDITRRAAMAGNAANWSASALLTAGFELPPPSAFTAYDGAIGVITSAPSGTTSSLAAGTTDWAAAYVPGSFTRGVTLTLPPAVGNLAAGIAAMKVDSDNNGSFQYGFNPSIGKDSGKSLVLNIAFSWGLTA